jgi:hypothetical protein
VFKRGIWRLRELQSVRELPPKKSVSYSLLKFARLGTSESILAFEKIIRNLELSSGVWRTTYRGRLRDVDELVSPHLAAFCATKEQFEVHDWAASDALVSSEWAQLVFRAFPHCKFAASDVTLHLVEVTRGNREAYVFEPDGTPLQYIRPPFVIPLNKKESSAFLINHMLRVRAGRFADSLRRAVSVCRWADVDDPTEFCFPPVTIRLLPLVHPEALNLHRQKPGFRIMLHTALSPLRERVHVIRTINIFQRGYFGDAQLANGAQAVLDSLVTGGLWILGRTVEETKPVRNEVSIFKKTHHSFQLLDRLNGGSELEESLNKWGLLESQRLVLPAVG